MQILVALARHNGHGMWRSVPIYFRFDRLARVQLGHRIDVKGKQYGPWDAWGRSVIPVPVHCSTLRLWMPHPSTGEPEHSNGTCDCFLVRCWLRQNMWDTCCGATWRPWSMAPAGRDGLPVIPDRPLDGEGPPPRPEHRLHWGHALA